MFKKRVKTDGNEMNYKLLCRCCLKSDAEFFKLDILTDGMIGDNENEVTSKIPLMRLLLFCTRTENVPELPQYICVECSKSLQIAYFFIQNSLRAYEILCRKLCPGKVTNTLRNNGQSSSESIRNNFTFGIQKAKPKPLKTAVRHECKVCGVIIYGRMEMKQHIRQHAMTARYACRLCKFVTFKQRQLPEHYRSAHGLTAMQIDQQLRIRKSLQASAAITKARALAAPDDYREEVKVCTLEDMELLIPTVLTPEDFTHPQLDADQLRDIEQQLSNSLIANKSESDVITPPDPKLEGSSSGNMSIGAEFLVMPDGSLQQVNDGGVVFEYIDDSKTKSTTTSNISLHTLLDDSKSDVSYDKMGVNVNPALSDGIPQITVKPPPRPGPGSIAALKHKCKQCPKAFPTVARLKSHQLTHSHLPKFYCDQCANYFLRSADLIQHHLDAHNTPIGPNQIHTERSTLTMGTDRRPTFSCDMCLFETPSSFLLSKHYCDKHKIQPNDVQLRPSWINECKDKLGGVDTNVGDTLKSPQIPMGITYPSKTAVAAAEAIAVTNSTGQLHPSTQVLSTSERQSTATATTTSVVSSAGELNVVVDTTSLFYAATAAVDETATTVPNEYSIFSQEPFSTTSMIEGSSGMLPVVDPASAISGIVAAANAVPSSGNPNASMFGDMQDFIDDTDVAAICTIPADDMPVVDGDDIVIDNNNMSLDFDAENLFEDFEEDVEVGEEDDDAENDDENDNNEAAADQNLLLTSDDDDVDDFDDEQSKHLQKPYCIFCNKKFTSQYKFENHMFVHRGLAPYRCELCTNLYNMKRLLIRHYKTVHKRMPTRDMVQAKGDKILVERTAIEKLNVTAEKSPMLMCAKCPFECEEEDEMRSHLNTHHGINDGVSIHANEVFIIRKLPYECPRCIRSFAAKHTLTRHLQRSHLVDTIIEMQTGSEESTTITLPNNVSDDGSIATKMEVESSLSETVADQNIDTAPGGGDGDVNVKCEDSVINSETGIKTDREATVTQATSIPTAETETIQESPADATSITASSTPLKAEATTSMLTTTIDETPSATTSAADSTIFPTPASFDFDLDFIGNASNASSLKPQSFSILPSPSQLLNGSDKLLTDALEPSPVKGVRPKLPRTPIFVCKQCNQTFDELAKLLQHELQEHSSDNVSPRSSYQHQCKICKTSYRTVTLLNYHMKRHVQRKVQCKQCSKEFASTLEMEFHKAEEHDNKKVGNYKCNISGCLKSFRNKLHLTRHQSTDHKPVRHECPECGVKMFSNRMKNHKCSYKGTVSYKCPKCEHSYLRRYFFRKHALRDHKWNVTEDEINEAYSRSKT